MTTKEIIERNERILNNWKQHGVIDNATELNILGALLDVKIPQSALKNFVSCEWLEAYHTISWKSYGSDKTILKTINKLRKARSGEYEEAITIKDQLMDYEMSEECQDKIEKISDGIIQLSYYQLSVIEAYANDYTNIIPEHAYIGKKIEKFIMNDC